MIIYFDKYAYRSNAASALLLKKRVELDLDYHKGNFLIFSTTKNYKGSISETDSIPESKFVTQYILKFRSIFFLYLGFYFYYFKNANKIKKIISHSAPGSNLFFFAFSPFAKKTHYVIQDVYPDAIMHSLGLIKLKFLFKWFLKLSYSRLGSTETIGKKISEYLMSQYNHKSPVKYNPQTVGQKLKVKELSEIPKKIKLCFSGNYSNSHGYSYPLKIIQSICNSDLFSIDFRGFGKNFKKISTSFNHKNISYSGPMSKTDYINFLESSNAILILSEFGYEKYCLSCKFNSLIETKKPLIYIGPECEISEYIKNLKIGISFTRKSYSNNEIFSKIMSFYNSFLLYNKNAISNNHYDLNKFFIEKKD